MKKMQRRGKRFTAWLLCMALAFGCFSSLNPTALAAEDNQNYELMTEWLFNSGLDGWNYNAGWTEEGIKADAAPVVECDDEMLKLTTDYSKANEDSKGWAQAAVSCGTDQADLTGASRVMMDVFYEADKLTNGSLTMKVSLGDGDGSTTLADSSDDADMDSGLIKKTITIDLGRKATAADFVICVVGQNTTYSGSVWLDNIRVLKDSDNETPVNPVDLPALWTFDDDIAGWSYGGAWEYDGPTDISWDSDRQMLKLDVDYSGNADSGWSEFKVDYQNPNGLDLTGADCFTMDVIFDPSQMSGGLSIKVSSDGVLDDSKGINIEDAEPYGDGLQRVSYETTFNTIRNGSIEKFTIGIVGNNTHYNGSIWLDNIKFDIKVEPDEYVDATETIGTATAISGSSDALTVNGRNYLYAREIQLADPDADDSAIALYQYLKAVGESNSALYGHMEDTVLKAGASDLSYSDTEDMTGSLAAINGLDCGGLFSGFADKYNSRHPRNSVPNTTEGDIEAAALLSNEAIAEGAIMTLSCHMPNFAFADEINSSAAKTYDRYDYGKADSYNLQGGCMNQILPGGAFNPQFTAFLDLVAEYAEQVEGAILFRPFHENTGSWFWWGKAFCDAETYKSVFRYTVEYLRDEKDVHNLLYVYGPGSEAATIAEYSERYPGDAFVDMVGFDTYDDKATNDAGYTFMKNFEMTVKLTDQFAKEHGKLFAVTETGIANSAMKKTGNERPEWFSEILDIITDPAYDCTYYMVWSNYDSKSNYYTPFVVSVAEDGTLHGHELMDGFIRFYNDKRSIFAADQQNINQPNLPTVTGGDSTGYFVAPTAGVRILEPTAIRAQVSSGVTDASIFVSNGTAEIPLETTVSGRTVTAMLTANALVQLGEAANGKILLRSGSKTLAEITVIYNIKEKEPDPYMVDDFESYYGVDTILTAAWATNKATGSNVTLALDSENDGYAMKFDYSETSGGWAGATITKTVDWSDCNALSFWTVPDGKQQKTVIQIDANSTCYEVYLNLYDAYNARAGQPTLVTIPFSEFCQRDTEGNPKGGLLQDCGSVGSFGLWVNAIDNEFLVDGTVSGTIWYDNITAVTSDYTEPTFETPGSTPEPPVSQTYTITAAAGIGGSISPNGSVSVEGGKNQSFTITAQSGYRISGVKVDGKSVGAVSTYTFADVVANHTIEAAFTVYSSRPSGGSSGSNSTKPKPSTPSTPSTPSEPSKPSGLTVPNEPSTPSQPTQKSEYTDVSSGSWYSGAVQYVSERGLMTGTAANTFSPNGTMNRAMLWTILARLNNVDTSGGTVWYEKSMTWAVSQGISDGTGALENITREQMAAMLWRYRNSPTSETSLSQFSDSDTVSNWAVDAIRWAAANGLLAGSNGNLNPRGTVTRAEAAAILMRFCQNIAA